MDPYPLIKQDDSFKKHSNKKIKEIKNNPNLDLISIRELNQNSNDPILKSFNSFFKQIIDGKNEHFLSGELNIIDYLISKYSNISITQDQVKYIKKLSLRIHFNMGFLNQFGIHLPELEELILSGSVIPKIEDIGSNFYNLRVLNISNSLLSDLNGKYKVKYF
jgi:hypothetical protein